MAYFLRSHPINTITTRRNAQTSNRIAALIPHTFVAARRFGALKVKYPIRKNAKNQNRKQKCKWHASLHHNTIPPKATRPTKPALARTRTHRSLGLLVGAGIQQQPRAVRVTTVSGHNQRRPSALRARVPMCPPLCDRSAAASARRLSPPPQPPPCTEMTRRMQVNEITSRQ